MTIETSMTTVDSVTALLDEPRFELMPFDSFGDQIQHLPDGATIAITTSPTLGLDATIEWTEKAAAAGYEVVPHVAARYVENEDHLDTVAGRLANAGVTDIFVPGGDRKEPLGEFKKAHDLLVTLERLDYSFEDVGITGYPEGHEFLSAETLREAMARKDPYATYIVTQLCFDSEDILTWINSIRERGVDLPVEVGIPGVMNYQRLIGIAQKVGVGDSIEFLRKTTGVFGFLRQLVGSRGKYRPDTLIDGLAPYADDPTYGIRGIHIYTMNQVTDVEDWRRERLEGR